MNKKIRIGIICPSEIALRRFMPALQLVDGFEFIGIGVCTEQERFGTNFPCDEIVKEILKAEYDKAQVFIDQYGGKIFDGYETIVKTPEIDAIYIPLPPALHYKWSKMALENKKHVLVEKPSTTSAEDTKNLTQSADWNNLALHENYMFIFHDQLTAINDIIASGEIGDVRLYSIKFGFPLREINDFRYNKALGGGALIDAGGYTIKYATILLGETTKIVCAQMNYTDKFEVDVYGSATLVNNEGTTAQIAFGMDNNYKCELEVWGSAGCLTTGRILTAPGGFIPQVTIRNGNIDKVRDLPADDSFLKSIQKFEHCIKNKNERIENYKFIEKQAELIDEFKRLAN